MLILGYIGYAVLCYFAITWAIGVRVQLGAGIHTIFGALFFLISAVAIAGFGFNKLHSFWVIPAGFVITVFIVPVALNIPFISAPFRIASNIYVSIVRVGIPAEKIRDAQNAGIRETIEEFLGGQSKNE